MKKTRKREEHLLSPEEIRALLELDPGDLPHYSFEELHEDAVDRAKRLERKKLPN